MAHCNCSTQNSGTAAAHGNPTLCFKFRYEHSEPSPISGDALSCRTARSTANNDTRRILAILEAFLRPALTIGSDRRFGGRAFIRLRARLATEPEAVSRKILASAFDESSGAFLSALGRALPDIPRADLEWRFHFMLGAMFYTMADAGPIQSLTDGRCDPGRVEDALLHIIPFVAAGFRSVPCSIRAIAKSRKQPK